MSPNRRSPLTQRSQKLRREMTRAERHIWYDFLKSLPVTVNRQKVIGPYIVDFYCAEAQVVIELDGGQHFEEAGIREDRKRDGFLRSRGIQVLRFSNADVMRDFDSVCEEIRMALEPSSVTSAEGLGATFPQRGKAEPSSVTSAEGLGATFPQRGKAEPSSVTSAEGLGATFPQRGKAEPSSVTSAEGLGATFPQRGKA